MKILLLVLLALLNVNSVFGQSLPAERRTDWSNPGSDAPFIYQQTVNLIDFGADNTGVLPSDSAMLQALAALNGPGRIYVNSGTYLFTNTITLHDSLIIQGEVDSITLKPLALFKLQPGENKDGILIGGTEQSSGYTINYALQQGSKKIYVTQPNMFWPGMIIRLKAYDDADLVNNNWALYNTGQIAHIVAVDGDSLLLDKPLRRSYSGILPPEVMLILPRKQVHISCIQLERGDETTSQTANIAFNMSAHCSVSSISSQLCNFAHITVDKSTNISIENSFFKDGFSYGGGGKAYGVLLQSASGNCYVHQNNFEHLRHSMILQSGANGNVFAYNYSANPFWSESLLPANSAGDAVLHGNYPYMNLFEGNVIQNIVIDNSHDINGPYNTFYRNRAELYGIFMNTGPASDSQNFIGNQVSNTTSLLYGMYSLQGINHFQYGNIVKGTVTPGGTAEPTDSTLFDYPFGSFYFVHAPTPPIQHNNWQQTTPFIETQYRYNNTQEAVCGSVDYLPTGIAESASTNSVALYPNPFNNTITISGLQGTKNIGIYNTVGALVYTEKAGGTTTTIDLSHIPQGLYLIRIENAIYRLVKI